MQWFLTTDISVQNNINSYIASNKIKFRGYHTSLGFYPINHQKSGTDSGTALHMYLHISNSHIFLMYRYCPLHIISSTKSWQYICLKTDFMLLTVCLLLATET